MPATLSLLAVLYPQPQARRRAFMAWTVVVGAGGLAGPLIGGLLVEYFSWRAGFWINIPLAVLTGILTWARVPESRAARITPVDWPGTTLSTAGLLALVWAVIESPVSGWTSPRVLTAYLVAALLLGAFLAHQRRTAHPLLPLPILCDRNIGPVLAAVVIMCFALFGALFLLTLYLQGPLGYSPLQAGWRTLPLTAGTLPGAAAALALLATGRLRHALTGGLLVISAGWAVLATIDVASGYLLIATAQLLMGAGAGLFATAANEVVMTTAGKDHAGLASALNDTTRELGSTLGVAVLGSLTITLWRNRLPDTPHSSPSTLSILTALTRSRRIPAEARHGVRETFTDALATTGLLTAVLVLAAAAVLWHSLRTGYTAPARQATARAHQ